MTNRLNLEVPAVHHPDPHSIFTTKLELSPIFDGPLSGIAVSIKDNIDIAGTVTTAGAKAFLHGAPAATDAPVVARLKAAGAQIFAKTNMSEFAYSCHGINSHFGTPVNPWSDGSGPRIPGGSSSGAAVAVSRGIGEVAIGTDTSGSVRLPAALCGVVGFKPRQRRVSLDGIVPLAVSYDCVGILARSVGLTQRVFEVIADTPSHELAAQKPEHRPYRLLWPINFVDGPESGISEEVANAVSEAVVRLVRAGFEIVRQQVPLLPKTWEMVTNGGVTACEAFAFHRSHLEQLASQYEPYTLSRLEVGSRCTPEHYQALLARRNELIKEASQEFSGFDAILHPASLIVAPLLNELESDEAKVEASIKLMRTTVFANILDQPSISIPCHKAGSAPVGLLFNGTGSEEALLRLALAAERALD